MIVCLVKKCALGLGILNRAENFVLKHHRTMSLFWMAYLTVAAYLTVTYQIASWLHGKLDTYSHLWSN